jgi:hypothetical protein
MTEEVLRHALTEIASYALAHRARPRQLAEVMKSSAGIRLSPLARLWRHLEQIFGTEPLLAGRDAGV